jgi:DNA (cytosine-5)-methyltransferase 1
VKKLTLEEFNTRSAQWEAEPELGRVAHGIPNRMDRLRCLGNAVVPQVAEHLGKCILEHERRRVR